MSPRIIADTDDEDEPGSSPLAQSPRESGASVKAGHVSHSESTDPAFFQSVLDEQSAAAQEQRQVSELHTWHHDDDPEQGYQIKSHEESGAIRSPSSSSISSIMSPDPLHEDQDDDIKPQANLTSRFERGTTKARAKSGPGRYNPDHDPWEIPSSPEEARATRVKRQERRPRKTLHDGTSNVANETLTHEYLLVEAQASDMVGTRRSKRRKANEGHALVEDAEHVDLVPLPATQEGDEIQRAPSLETMPPPTLPIDRSSFAVVPNGSKTASRGSPGTRAQISEQESEEELSQDRGPSRFRPGALLMQSSGSATNVNTPRSEPHSSRKIPEDSEPRAIREVDLVEEASDAQTSDLSHRTDIAASLAVPVERSEDSKRKSKQKTVLSDSEEGEGPGCASDFKQEFREAEDDGSDFAASPVKPKKKRGRPRKEKDQLAGPEPPPKNEQPGKGPKKKRGRPRKGEQQTASKEPNAETSDNTVEANGSTTAEAEHAAKPNGDNLTTNEQGTKEGSTMSAVDGSDVNKTPRAESLKEHAVATKQGPSKLDTPKAGAPGSTSNRPLYRVGLSKRSRIAPLLKIVRK